MNIKKGLTFLLLLGLLVLGGGYLGYHAYKSARQTRLIKQARNYLAKASERKALLCLQRALKYNPKDIEACRLMGDLAERTHSPGALIWRNRVVEQNPRSTDDRLALVQTALKLHDYASATNALEGVEPKGKKTAAYHNVAGAVAAATGQPAQAEAHFVEASRLEPQNAAPQLNLAVVRLLSTNAAALADARGTLTRIASNPTNSFLRCQALRELTTDALRHKQVETALALSKQLLLETNSVFEDRFLRLSLLQQTRDPEFRPTLAAFQTEVAGEPAKASELAVWQFENTTPSQTLNWLRRLPPATQTNQAIMRLTAECYSLQQDWRGLQADLERQNWAELEFVRHAFKARALRGQDLGGAAKSEWELAFKAANPHKGPLVMLFRQVDGWKWESESEEILWAIVNNFPEERWAFATLTQAMYVDGRTRPLMMLFSQQTKRAPADLEAKNNLAMTALLLEAKEFNPHELAREVYQKSPTNASYVSTYGFSLYLQAKSSEALKIMERLNPQELEKPSVAGYYGLILKATGHAAKAQTCLGSASKAQLLPEERKLFDRAKAGV